MHYTQGTKLTHSDTSFIPAAKFLALICLQKARQVFKSRKLPDLIFACSDRKTHPDCIYTQPPAFLDSSSYSFGSFSFLLETSACLHELFSLQHFQFTIMLSTASRQKSCSISFVSSGQFVKAVHTSTPYFSIH